MPSCNTHLPFLGVQARASSLDEPTAAPRRRITSEGQNGPDDSTSPDVPLRSPIRCVSPEFVNAIAMNPGGRPKEVENAHFRTTFHIFSRTAMTVCFSSHLISFLLQKNMHSYREAFEELEGGHISPTPTVGGEVFPQTPAFPVSPQTPYFNLCKSPLWLIEGTVELRCNYFFKIYILEFNKLLFLAFFNPALNLHSF